MDTTPFWFVWNENGNAPRHKHISVESAATEAQRLARMNPGDAFIVLQSVCSFQVDNMQRVDLRPSNDEIPF